ncbi:hypothetical protein [uncultured Alistipes sp.]|jgi:hypothetical protein|uniref:hypothetical protein n=1 Tax=uncultured Alistipes sp. TaxID=538949 RepID=UPI0025EB15C2|nr:hypothetical protein [uncultured Alistipes sp.]
MVKSYKNTIAIILISALFPLQIVVCKMVVECDPFPDPLPFPNRRTNRRRTFRSTFRSRIPTVRQGAEKLSVAILRFNHLFITLRSPVLSDFLLIFGCAQDTLVRQNASELAFTLAYSYL